jgi:uncharacterized protein (DUF58 family)
LAFDEAVRGVVPSRSKQTHLGSILSVLVREKPAKKTGLYDILRYVADEKLQKGMVVLVSDLFVPRDGLFKGLKLLRQRGHDVLVLHVLDDEELDFTYSGTTRFEGLEESGELVCDPRSLREGYLVAMQNFLAEVRRGCARNRIDYRTVRSSEHIDAVLRHFISSRAGRRKASSH